LVVKQQKKFFQAIGLARKAHQVVYGQRLLEMIQSQKVFVVILTVEMGVSQRKKVINKANYYKIEVIDSEISKHELNQILKTPNNISAIGISDQNLACLLRSYQEGEKEVELHGRKQEKQPKPE